MKDHFLCDMSIVLFLKVLLYVYILFILDEGTHLATEKRREHCPWMDSYPKVKEKLGLCPGGLEGFGLGRGEKKVMLRNGKDLGFKGVPWKNFFVGVSGLGDRARNRKVKVRAWEGLGLEIDRLG